MNNDIKTLAGYINRSKYTVAVTGAGISLSAGGVTYGELTRILHSDKKVMNDPKRLYNAFRLTYLDSMFLHEPSLTHKALREMEENGSLQGIITTNEDCMHSIAGSKKVAEIQGGFQQNRCRACGCHYDGYDIWNKGTQPMCEKCGGIILPYQLYSNIGLVEEEVRKARTWISKADLIIVIGTHGYFGSAYWDWQKRDAIIVQINPGRTQFDHIADLNIKEASDDVFAALANIKRVSNG